MTSTRRRIGSPRLRRRGRDNQARFVRAGGTAGWCACCAWRSRSATVLVLARYHAVSWLDPMRSWPGCRPTQGQLVISGTKITMEAPKLAGFTKDGRGYELNARAAAQDITKPDIVELHDIRAKIETQDKTPINLTAMDGLFDRKTGILKLAKDVMLTSPSYRDQSRGSHRRHRERQVVSDKPVAGEDAGRHAQLQPSRSRRRRRSRSLRWRRGDDAGRWPDLGANWPGGSVRWRSSSFHAALAVALALRAGAATLRSRRRARHQRPNALQGFSQNRDQPVQIEAATLEVRDKDKHGDLQRQRARRAGRYHHALQGAGGLLRQQGQGPAA